VVNNGKFYKWVIQRDDMTKNNISQIQGLPLIVDVERVEPGEILEDKLGQALSTEDEAKARENAENVLAYRVMYESQSHLVEGFIVEPREASKPLPCVIRNRGGSVNFSSITEGRLFAEHYHMSSLARRGYIVIASQYSGCGRSQGKDTFGGSDIEDVLNLQKILEVYDRADESRIGMLGGSRGGMMTYIALAQVDWIKAAVIRAGPTDLCDIDTFRQGFREHVLVRRYGGSNDESRKRSALYWVDQLPKNVPILLMHGTADTRVDPQDSIRMAAELERVGIPHELVLFEEADHQLRPLRNAAMIRAYNWLDRYVKEIN
jgi:dipeptidyl aminopeptidase/acylaminoacyl peptidase